MKINAARMYGAYGAILLLSLGFAAPVLPAPERPLVLTVTPFMQYFQCGDESARQSVALRDQVLVELMRAYDCTLLSRSHGYSLALEEAIKNMSALCEPAYAGSALCVADYTFSGMLQLGPTNYECVLRMVDLHSKDDTGSRTFVVNLSSITGCAPQIASSIATAVGLSKRALPRELVPASGSGHAWVVMPFPIVRINGPSAQRVAPPKQDLTRLAEAALLSGAGNRIVEHAASDDRAKVSATQSSDRAGDAGAPSVRDGADRMLSGLIDVEGESSVRLDLFDVQTETSEVLSAVTRHYGSQDALAEGLGQAIAELQSQERAPSSLVAASADQRLREAQLYLEIARANIQAHTKSGSLSVVAHAEAAYLLSRDNPAFVREIAALLCECAELAREMLPTRSLELVKLAEKMVGAQNDPTAGGPYLLLRRSLVYYRIKQYGEALRMVDLMEKQYPGALSEDARTMRADILQAQGKADEVLARLTPYENDYNALLTRAKAYRHRGQDDGEFITLDKVPLRLLGSSQTRYFELLAKYRGPHAAVARIGDLTRENHWTSSRSDVMLQLAQYRYEAGDKKGAANICQRLWEQGQTTYWNWAAGVDYWTFDMAAYKKNLSALRAKTGAGTEKWVKACKIQPFPAQCAIYLQPLGSPDAAMLGEVRADVKRFFGARTEILPELSLSKRELSYCRDNNKYDANRLLPDTLLRLSVPDDALAVVIVTREPLFVAGLDWIYAQNNDAGILCSYSIWLGREKDAQELGLRNAVIGGISNTLGLRGEFPCISAGSGDASSPLLMKNAYCEAMQDRYRQLDLAAEQRKAVERLRKAGVRIIPK